MTFYIRKPHTTTIQQQLAALESPLSYSDMCKTRNPDEATLAELARAYHNIDHNQVLLGHGQDVFERAKSALREWGQFPAAWTQIFRPNPTIEPECPLAILVRLMGVYSLNFARIVYVIDEAHRFGFAYGTTIHHEETGEERFLVEWRPEDDSVWYAILAFSSPQSLLAKVGYPYVRHVQKRFARDSLESMKRAVNSSE